MLVPRRGYGGSASCIYRDGKGADQRSFGTASAGGKVGSVNGRMGAGNENQQQERKKKQSLDMSLMSDGLLYLFVGQVPDDEITRMFFLDGAKNEPHASRRRSSEGIGALPQTRNHRHHAGLICCSDK